MSWMLSLAVVGAVMLAPFFASDAGAADWPAGFALDEKLEKELADHVAKLAEAVEAKSPDYAKAASVAAAARGPAVKLDAMAAEKSPETQPDAIDLPEKTPLAVPDGADGNSVRKLWHAQLQMNVSAVRGLLSGDRQTVGEWVGWPLNRVPKNRAPRAVGALREAEKAAALLARPSRVVRFGKGELLFADDFSKGSANWLTYGDSKATNEKDAFRFRDTTAKHPDAMMWTKQQFAGDLVVEFDFIPHSEGASPGALFIICGLPVPGKDLSVCVGDSMDTYNRGINGYHFSMHRGNTGLGNVRRVGPGLMMLASGPDPCPKVGRSYRVSVGKFGPAIYLLVDGKLIHHWYDAGTYGPVLDAGHIGLRHWAGCDASYRDFRVYRLVKSKSDESARDE